MSSGIIIFESDLFTVVHSRIDVWLAAGGHLWLYLFQPVCHRTHISLRRVDHCVWCIGITLPDSNGSFHFLSSCGQQQSLTLSHPPTHPPTHPWWWLSRLSASRSWVSVTPALSFMTKKTHDGLWDGKQVMVNHLDRFRSAPAQRDMIDFLPQPPRGFGSASTRGDACLLAAHNFRYWWLPQSQNHNSPWSTAMQRLLLPVLRVACNAFWARSVVFVFFFFAVLLSWKMYPSRMENRGVIILSCVMGESAWLGFPLTCLAFQLYTSRLSPTWLEYDKQFGLRPYRVLTLASLFSKLPEGTFIFDLWQVVKWMRHTYWVRCWAAALEQKW